jgi:uncharacterized membrane protein
MLHLYRYLSPSLRKSLHGQNYKEEEEEEEKSRLAGILLVLFFSSVMKMSNLLQHDHG